ncbi:MAG TPA: PhzF family phenazine biosynthesis isomerase, partial [Ferruginibacter sp.]|nr:PhzF family phenazine biosynthesis isomerase [Ferruginibacter sp.]
MKLTLYQIDAFANKIFGGNPAAVIPLEQWLDAPLMQQIALENNLSETVFFVPAANGIADFEIRWFTPEVEINLCGHATLASAYTDLPGGVLYLTVRNNTFADLIARIGRAYRNNDITLSDSPGNMAPAAADLLASKRPLVVLDGLLNPQATSEFLQRCI